MEGDNMQEFIKKVQRLSVAIEKTTKNAIISRVMFIWI